MVWIQALALLFVICVTLIKLFTLSVPQFLHLKIRSNEDIPKFCKMETFYKKNWPVFSKSIKVMKRKNKMKHN